MARTSPIQDLRSVLVEDVNKRGTRPLTNAGLVQLLDALIPAEAPKPQPLWPKSLWGKYSRKERKFFEQKSFNSALDSGRFVEHPAQAVQFPVQLWKDGNPSPYVVWNRLEEQQAEQAGYAKDESRTEPIKGFRPAEKPETWPAFIEQCQDVALRAQAELHWNQSQRNTTVAGHLSDWLSKIYFPEQE